MKLKPVHITWEDACGSEGPYEPDKTAFEPLMTDTVGFLIENTKERIVVAQDIIHQQAGSDQARAVIIIPKGMVRRVKRLT